MIEEEKNKMLQRKRDLQNQTINNFTYNGQKDYADLERSLSLH